jgi:2-dehydro-3-deoxy-D-gluconate 5-dehydrogenase
MKSQSIFDVAGRVVLVTGGSSGIGYQIARVMVRAGAKVASVARSHDAALSEALLSEAGERCEPVFIAADIREHDDIVKMFDVAEQAFGTVTVIFNNAGVSERQRAGKISRDSWRDIMSVNIDGQFFVAQEAARRMMEAKCAGSIINTTSILATGAMRGTAAYSISKAAVTQMTRSLALEWAAHQIRVNAIAPGWFPTRMNAEFLGGLGGDFIRSQNPMKRLGEAGDLDGAALLLASDASLYMTGTVMTVDGGQSLVS